jgi:hypothetical protein
VKQSEVTEITEITEPSDSQAWLPPAPAEIPTAERAPRRRWLPTSLAGRLVLGVVALVIAVVAVLGVSTYVALSYFLSQRLDQQLNSISNVSVINSAASATSSASLSSPQVVWLAELDVQGRVFNVVNDEPALKPMLLTDGDRQNLAKKFGKPRTITTTCCLSSRLVPRQLRWRPDSRAGACG